jgi:outer membrane protein OmpA-like peptidoglycan-associated protein
MKTLHFLPLLSLGLAAITLGGCASTEPPELANAKSAYDEASHGMAAQLAPVDLHAAQEQLARAQRSFNDNGASQETRDLAYAAQRKAELAEVSAKTAAASKDAADARAELEQAKDAKAKATETALVSTQQQVATAQQQVAIEATEVAAADARAKRATADLERIASVKREPRGMVITLSGSVLFASAKSDLLAQAQVKLSQVADALVKQDPDSKIVVQGFTDSQGAASFNQDLSQHRAEAVREYLVSHGIAPDRVTAQGMGPGNPVADNATAEGRADNRRVEIVVQPATHAAP